MTLSSTHSVSILRIKLSVCIERKALCRFLGTSQQRLQHHTAPHLMIWQSFLPILDQTLVRTSQVHIFAFYVGTAILTITNLLKSVLEALDCNMSGDLFTHAGVDWDEVCAGDESMGTVPGMQMGCDTCAFIPENREDDETPYDADFVHFQCATEINCHISAAFSPNLKLIVGCGCLCFCGKLCECCTSQQFTDQPLF